MSKVYELVNKETEQVHQVLDMRTIESTKTVLVTIQLDPETTGDVSFCENGKDLTNERYTIREVGENKPKKKAK